MKTLKTEWAEWLIIAILVIIDLCIVFKPIQIFQTSWVVPPACQVKVHWHGCLSIGGKEVFLNESQKILGFAVQDYSTTQPLLVSICKQERSENEIR